MRIGIDCRIYGAANGYMGSYMEQFVSHLAQTEDEHEYVLFFHDRDVSDFILKSHRLHIVKTAAKIGSLAEQTVLLYELYKEKLDVVLGIAPYIPLLYRKKTVAILPDLASYFYPSKDMKGTGRRNWSNFILRQSLRKAHKAIVLSSTLKRDVIEIFDIAEEKICVIPPMFLGYTDTGTQSTLEVVQQFLVAESIQSKYILITGDLREYKNIPRFLQAYNQLLQEGTVDVDLVLIGKEDPTYHEIRSELIELGLQKRVHIYNVLDESKIAFFQRNATLFVLPSLYEGSEQAILAPIFYGTPILSSNLPSITTVLSKEEAIFFRPMSVPDIQDTLKQALKLATISNQKKDISSYESTRVSEEIRRILCSFEENK